MNKSQSLQTLPPSWCATLKQWIDTICFGCKWNPGLRPYTFARLSVNIYIYNFEYLIKYLNYVLLYDLIILNYE